MATEALVLAHPGQRDVVEEVRPLSERERLGHRLVGPGGGDRARRLALGGAEGDEESEGAEARDAHGTPLVRDTIAWLVRPWLFAELPVCDKARHGVCVTHEFECIRGM